MALIEEYQEPFFAKRMQDVMFCAHDEDEHTVRWGEVAEAWLVENKRGLVRCTPSLLCALQSVGQYLGTPLENFTICSQP